MPRPMPVFECARCNHLTYSASRFTSLSCDRCGAALHRALDHALSFDEARSAPRALSAGDHCCVPFDAPEDVAPLCAQIARHGLAEGARVIAHPPPAVRAAMERQLDDREREQVEWRDPSALYGPGFDPDELVARYRAVADAEPRPLFLLGGPAAALPSFTTCDAFRRFERLVGDGTIETGMVVVCLYDRSLHGPEFHAIGEETHPLAADESDTIRRNERFSYVAAGLPSA